uniref:relaxase/mobilization nuclease domain-containing protein n=1 Tax=Roseburia inulinivorans TaxID=360807 RepID=UPI004038984B
MKERFDYGQNPDKTEGGELISSYGCDHMTVDAEFLLSKAKYKAVTGREQRRDADVLCYQIRQSFKPGEITLEEANRIGYETAMRWTKGKYAFFVATHTDKAHIHNHIYYNSTSLDCTRKFRDFIGSGRAVRRLSDRICLENDLSVITNPKLHSKGRFLHYGAWLGTERQPPYKEQLRLAINEDLAKRPADFDAFLRLMEASGFTVKHGRSGTISFLVPGQERPIPEQPVSVPAPPRRVNLIVDIQEHLRSGKGAAYARWAKVYNLKQMAAALQFMQEQNITEYDQLSAKAEDAVSRFHALTEQLWRTEADLSATSELMGAVVRYAKTRPVFDGYKAAKYSRKYLAEHEAELADYRAAKATMGELLGGEKLPKMAELKEKRRQLAARKKALYAEYRSAQEEMRQSVAVKSNIDHLLGVTDGQRKKEQER